MKAHRHTLIVQLLSWWSYCCIEAAAGGGVGGGSRGRTSTAGPSSSLLWLFLPCSSGHNNKHGSVWRNDRVVGMRPLLAAVVPTTIPPTIGSVEEVQLLRTLALHGSGGTAASFRNTLEQWNTQWCNNDSDGNDDSATDHPPTTLRLAVTALDAPHSKNAVPNDAGTSLSSSSADHGGYSWWRMPPGVRSFTATEYDGFETSAAAVLAALGHPLPPPREHPILPPPPPPPPPPPQKHPSSFDLVVAHSQGAILIAALLALQQIDRSCHPRLGYILNGVAWPNPYTDDFEQLTDTTLYDVNIIVLVGARDRINPPDEARRVVRALQNAGAAVTVVEHPGGHGIPLDSNDVGRHVRAWLLAGTGGSEKQPPDTATGTSAAPRDIL